MERVEVAELRGGRHLLAMWPGLRRSTLLRAITTGTPSAKTRSAMKRSPAPIRSRADEDEEHGVDVLERRVDGALHALGQRVRGRWKPGRSASTSW